MTKEPPKLTEIQKRALEFIRSSLASTGTAPTLRELCGHMGYSAIGSAQDLVASLRRKGFLHTPDKQSARALILTPLALALQENEHESTETTFIIPGFEELPSDDHISSKEKRICTIRISVDSFPRPYPNPANLFAFKNTHDDLLEHGVLVGDWLIVNSEPARIAPDTILIFKNEKSVLITKIHKDIKGWFFNPPLSSEFPSRSRNLPTDYTIAGQVIGVQRVL